MKESIPWPVKFGAKLLLGAARVDYRYLKRARIIEHGRMEEAGFSRAVFNRHVITPLAERHRVPNGLLLELGPGDSVTTGFLGRASGFAAVALVDTGVYADLRPCAVNQANNELQAGMPVLPEHSSAAEVLACLSRVEIRYMTNGLQSLRELPAGSVYHSFSNTVLQHVHRCDLGETIRMLGRAHAPGSLCSHLIKFTDHFSGGFLNHRFPEWLMESELIKRAHLYTNRVSVEEFLDLFSGAGFELDTVAVDFYDRRGDEHLECHAKSELHFAVADRRVLRATLLLQKR